MTQGIYKIKNALDGKMYVGSSTHIGQRWQGHRWMLRNGRHNNPHLQRAWDKHGEDAFTFTVLEEVGDGMLLATEQGYLDELFAQGDCYNIAQDATASLRGLIRSKEHRRKLGEAHRGKKISEEHKRKLSEAHKGNQYALGHKHTEETKRKIGKASKGNKYSLGYKHTRETRQKMSAARKGKKFSEEHKRKISKAMLGKQNALGCKRGEETLRKMSENTKRQRARELSARTAAP